MTDQTKCLGILYPAHSAEDDYPVAATLLNPTVDIRVVHTSVGEDAHREDALRDTGDIDRLREGAEQLREYGVNGAMWACTSGSFVFGLEGARRQVEAIEQDLGVPVSSTSLAFVDAVKALELGHVAIAATYPEDVTRMFGDFLRDAGIDVIDVGSLGIITGVEVATLDRSQVLEFARANDNPTAEAILLPDTALHTIRFVDELEEAVGKPILTANQVTVWKGLQMIGYAGVARGLGRLWGSDHR